MGPVSARTAPRRAIAPRRRNPAGLIVGTLLLGLGLGLLGWFGYQYVGTSIVAKQDFQQTTAQLQDEWSNLPSSNVDLSQQSGQVDKNGNVVRVPGDALGLMRIPAWGDSWVTPIYDGTDPGVLARGLGWYESTVGPGQVGNFSVAGHSVTHGEPFRRLMDLPSGSTVEVETVDKVYTYVIDSSTVVKDTDTWVLDPVPGKTDEQPTQELITLTTCQDFFHSPDRYIAFGHLVSTKIK